MFSCCSIFSQNSHCLENLLGRKFVAVSEVAEDLPSQSFCLLKRPSDVFQGLDQLAEILAPPIGAGV